MNNLKSKLKPKKLIINDMFKEKYGRRVVFIARMERISELI